MGGRGLHHLSISSENKTASGMFCAQTQRDKEMQWHLYMNGLQISLLLIDDILDGLSEYQQCMEKALP